MSQDTNLTDIESKIANLLAKTVDRGCSKAEAEAAAEAAARLAAKYAVDIEKVIDRGPVKMAKETVPCSSGLHWVQSVAVTVGKIFGVVPIVFQIGFMFAGESLDVKLSAQSFAAFTSNARKNANRAFREEFGIPASALKGKNHKMASAWITSYLKGYAAGLRERVVTTQLELKSADSMALIPLDKKIVNAQDYTKSFTRERKSRQGQGVFADPYGRGQEDGRGAQIRPALN